MPVERWQAVPSHRQWKGWSSRWAGFCLRRLGPPLSFGQDWLQTVNIKMDDLQGPGIAGLLTEHPEDMAALSPPKSRRVQDFSGLRQPEITFWSVWDGPGLVGCGALEALSPEPAEVKSMRTARTHHSKEVTTLLLQHLITAAKQQGYRQSSLETGSMAFSRLPTGSIASSDWRSADCLRTTWKTRTACS